MEEGQDRVSMCKHEPLDFRDPLRQPDRSAVSNSLTILIPLRCWDACLNLNTRAAAILLTANDMHNRGFVEDLEKGGIGEGMYIARWFSARRPLNGKAARCCGSRSVDMFYQFPGPRLPDAGRMAGYGMPIIVEGE